MKLPHQLALLATLLVANFHNNIVRADSQLRKTDTDTHQVQGDLVSNLTRDDNKQAVLSDLVAQKLQNGELYLQDSSNVDSDFDETKEVVMVVPVQKKVSSSAADSTITSQNEGGKMVPLTGNDGVIAVEEIAVAESRYRQAPLPYNRQQQYGYYYRPQQQQRPQYYGYSRPYSSYYSSNNNNYYYGRPRPYNTYNYGYNGYNSNGWNSYNSAPIIGFSIQG